MHDKLNKLLSVIPQDMTYDQVEGLNLLDFGDGITYFCKDLSAFTDRFPHVISSQLVEVL